MLYLQEERRSGHTEKVGRSLKEDAQAEMEKCWKRKREDLLLGGEEAMLKQKRGPCHSRLLVSLRVILPEEGFGANCCCPWKLPAR